MKIAILIIAAGESKRLGQTKQLLPYKGTTLLNSTIRTAQNSNIGKVHVVLGAHKIAIQATIADDIAIIHNEDWTLGMGSSIAKGVRMLSSYDAILVCLGDQPFLKENILQNVIAEQTKTQASIVYCAYQKAAGPPVLFLKEHFDALSKLNDDTGAKNIIKNYKGLISTVFFEKGDVDIDRDEDLKVLE